MSELLRIRKIYTGNSYWISTHVELYKALTPETVKPILREWVLRGRKTVRNGFYTGSIIHVVISIYLYIYSSRILDPPLHTFHISNTSWSTGDADFFVTPNQWLLPRETMVHVFAIVRWYRYADDSKEPRLTNLRLVSTPRKYCTCYV